MKYSPTAAVRLADAVIRSERMRRVERAHDLRLAFAADAEGWKTYVSELTRTLP